MANKAIRFGIFDTSKAFAILLDEMSISRADIARRIGKSRKTVSDWSRESSAPSLEDMRRTVDVLIERLGDLTAMANATKAALDLVDDIVKNHTALIADVAALAERKLTGAES